MIRFFLTFALVLSAAVADDTVSKKTKSTKAKKTEPKAIVANVIPKDAVLGADGSYHATDKSGKKWVYKNTPFGVAKAEERPPVDTTPVQEMTKVTIVGDVAKFERPSPFGVSKWEKKVADLTPDEKKIVENQKAKQN